MNQMAMNNNMNFFNPMMNNNFIIYNNQLQQMLQQQLMQMQQMMQQQQIEIDGQLCVHFRKRDQKAVSVNCREKDYISDVIKKYRKYSLDNNQTEKFIFNAQTLSPSLTVDESGLMNGANIHVVEIEGLRGG